MLIRLAPPNAFTAASQAWLPMMTGLPVCSSSRFCMASAPSAPSQKVSADMPITTASGAMLIATSTAPLVALRMLLSITMKLASSVTLVSGMAIRAKWLVTPRGRIMSYSGWTLVLVEGATTANFARYPSESPISFFLHGQCCWLRCQYCYRQRQPDCRSTAICVRLAVILRSVALFDRLARLVLLATGCSVR